MRAHDLDWLASYLPSDFSHASNIPSEILSAGGARQGKAASLERLEEIFQGFDTQYLEPGEIVVSGNRAILDVETKCQHRSSGSGSIRPRSTFGCWRTAGRPAFRVL